MRLEILQFIACLISFVLALDFSLSIITAQPYWVNAGGNIRLMGFFFGSYDLLAIPMAPLYSVLLDRGFCSFRSIFLFGLITNMIGNIIYAVAAKGPWSGVLLFGRLLTGLGASVSPFASTFVMDALPKDRQKDAANYIKYSAACARVFGPVLSSILVLTPASVDLFAEPTGTRLLNAFTLPGWFAAFFAAFVIVLVIKELPGSSTQNYQRISRSDDLGLPPTDASFRSAYKWFWNIWTLQMLATGIYWGFCGNLFAMGTVLYRSVDDGRELWKLYIAGIVGFVVSMILFMKQKRDWKPVIFLRVGFFLLALGQLFFSPYSVPSPQPLFYISVFTMTVGYGLLIPALNALNNIIGKAHSIELGRMSNVMLSMIYAVASVARFFGPAMFGLLVVIRSQHGDDASACQLDDSTEYLVQGCELENYLAVSVVGVILAFAGFLYSCFYKGL
jgi:hypothetical protein